MRVLALLLYCCWAQAQPSTTHTLQLQLFIAPVPEWPRERVLEAASAAAELLSQCGVSTRIAEPKSLPGETALDTPRSAALVARLRPDKPALFFVGETRNRPAFEAEAFGTGNTRSRPALAGTVWVTRHARDLPLVIAHELAHVLMDSGEHVNEPGNLMAEETSPQNASLTAAQCDRLRRKGAENGWLQPF